MSVHFVPIGDIVEKVTTWNPVKQVDGEFDYIDLSAVDQNDKRIVTPNRIPVTEAPSRARQIVRAGDVLVSTVRPNLNGVAKVVDAHDGMTASTGFCVLRPTQRHLDTNYLFQWVKSPAFVSDMVRKATGASYPAVSDRIVKDSEIPLPPLGEQKRIAAILDKADQLRQKRRQAIALIDSLTQSIFLEMFGDPANNPKNFPLMKVGELAEKYSDGPFGSNLKSEHYVDRGIRIIRLQNIGVGEFIDDDRAYITEEHFNRIAKHECLPGDVLIGTLGDPNLRACVQPKWLARALNKADCVQLRPNANIAVSEYCSSLLNQESTMRLAQGLVLGQTRGRISMGRLRDLELPIAPLPLQARFASIVRAHEEKKQSLRENAHQLGALFSSLQHRAFSGQL